MSRLTNRVAATLLVTTMALLTGCASDKPAPKAAVTAPPPPPPATLAQIKQELITAQAQLDVTTASMNALAKSAPADTQANYDKFTAEYLKMQTAADTCRSRAKDLKERTQAYYDTWNKQADVQNPDLRRSATEQRAAAQQTFDSIRSEVELTNLSFDQYMSQLKDIGNYLKTNQSPAALATISDTATKATANAADVKKHVDAVLAGINKIMAASGEGAK